MYTPPHPKKSGLSDQNGKEKERKKKTREKRWGGHSPGHFTHCGSEIHFSLSFTKFQHFQSDKKK